MEGHGFNSCQGTQNPGFFFCFSSMPVLLDEKKTSINSFPLSDDDDMTDLAEAIMEDCDGEVRNETVLIFFRTHPGHSFCEHVLL